jgi:hypothetical protein
MDKSRLLVVALSQQTHLPNATLVRDHNDNNDKGCGVIEDRRVEKCILHMRCARSRALTSQSTNTGSLLDRCSRFRRASLLCFSRQTGDGVSKSTTSSMLTSQSRREIGYLAPLVAFLITPPVAFTNRCAWAFREVRSRSPFRPIWC